MSTSSLTFRSLDSKNSSILKASRTSSGFMAPNTDGMVKVRAATKRLDSSSCKKDVAPNAKKASVATADNKPLAVDKDKPSDSNDRAKRSILSQVSPAKIINILAIFGLIYGLYTVATINQRSIDATSANKVISQSIVENNLSVAQFAPVSNSTGTKPVSISISSIDVTAPIEEVGVTESNNIGVPTELSQAGWFNQSAAPGQKGASIIDGHLGSDFNPGVFKDLEQVEVGQTIEITMSDSSVLVYQIKDKKVFDYDSTEYSTFYDPINPDVPGLNIITCNGGYLTELGTNEKRLIIYTQQVFA